MEKEKTKIKTGSWRGVFFTMSDEAGGFYLIKGKVRHTPCEVATISNETFDNLDNNSRMYADVRKKRRALRFCHRALTAEYERQLAAR